MHVLTYRSNGIFELIILFLIFFRQKVELKLEGHFLQRIVYEDGITYSLVGAASEVLGKLHTDSYNYSFNSLTINVHYFHRSLTYKIYPVHFTSCPAVKRLTICLLFPNRNRSSYYSRKIWRVILRFLSRIWI